MQKIHLGHSGAGDWRKAGQFFTWPIFGLAHQGKDIVFRFIIEYSSLRDFGPYIMFLYEDLWKMIFWLVLKLEISHKVIISWRILVYSRGFFWRLYFCMVKYLSFHNSSFACSLFNVNDKATVWHIPSFDVAQVVIIQKCFGYIPYVDILNYLMELIIQSREFGPFLMEKKPLMSFYQVKILAKICQWKKITALKLFWCVCVSQDRFSLARFCQKAK